MTFQAVRMARLAILLCVVAALACAAGCGSGATNRVAVWGNVTWKGAPVPSGIVYFSPDTKKGNSGPQGYALIKDGKFDTRDKLSKGCVTGAQVASVHGCDGQNPAPGRPYGSNLFAPFELAVEVAQAGGQMDLNVPDAAKPAASVESDKQ
jgi:hypothetical protein